METGGNFTNETATVYSDTTCDGDVTGIVHPRSRMVVEGGSIYVP